MAVAIAPRQIGRGAEYGLVAQHGTASPANRAQPSKATTTDLDSQALAAFGATSVDDGTTAFGFHANQKTVGTGAANFGGLVSTFHDELFVRIPRKP